MSSLVSNTPVEGTQQLLITAIIEIEQTLSLHKHLIRILAEVNHNKIIDFNPFFTGRNRFAKYPSLFDACNLNVLNMNE